MTSHDSLPAKALLPTALLLSLSGWGGLAAVVMLTLPRLGPRWLFFFFSVLAVSGTVLPIMAFLNRRFPTIPPATRVTVLREASLAGIYISTLAWLQLGRALVVPLAIVLALGFVLLEWLIRLRERSRWEP
jgi:hypothetical protein